MRNGNTMTLTLRVVQKCNHVHSYTKVHSIRETVQLGTPYDLKSVLHYHGKACYKGSGKPVLTRKSDGEATEGSALNMMSPIDQVWDHKRVFTLFFFIFSYMIEMTIFRS